MNGWGLRMEKKIPRRAPLSADDDANSARSQLRKRFELGGDSTSAPHPRVRSRDHGAHGDRKPLPRGEDESPSGADADADANENERPTLPTPRPRIALGAVPRRLVDDNELKELPLDHRAAFVLTSIDGKTPIRSIIDVTGMPPEEVIVLVERLVELKAVALL